MKLTETMENALVEIYRHTRRYPKFCRTNIDKTCTSGKVSLHTLRALVKRGLLRFIETVEHTWTHRTGCFGLDGYKTESYTMDYFSMTSEGGRVAEGLMERVECRKKEKLRNFINKLRGEGKG